MKKQHRANVIRAGLYAFGTCMALSGCSPYPFQPPVKAFSAGVDDLSVALAASPASLQADEIAQQTADWRETRPVVRVAAACDPYSRDACRLVARGRGAPDPSGMAAAKDRLDRAQATPAGGTPSKATDEPACTLPPGAEKLPASPDVTQSDAKAQAQAAQKIAQALQAYARALNAVANAADRAAYNAATAELANSVGALGGAIGAAAGPAGVAAGSAAKALTAAAALAAGTVLDARRTSGLRSAVEAACIPVRTLADVTETLLVMDWSDRMVARRETADRLAAGLGPQLLPKAYADHLQEAQAAVAALAALRDANPAGTALTMRKAHDDLLQALRDSSDAQVLAALGTAVAFADQAKSVRDALHSKK